jgi:hypothetical protein
MKRNAIFSRRRSTRAERGWRNTEKCYREEFDYGAAFGGFLEKME